MSRRSGDQARIPHPPELPKSALAPPCGQVQPAIIEYAIMAVQGWTARADILLVRVLHEEQELGWFLVAICTAQRGLNSREVRPLSRS